MGEEQQGQVRGSGGGLRRGVVTLVIIGAILWGFAFAALRTRGGHDFVAKQLSERFETQVQFERATLGFPLGITLANVATLDYADGQSGFHVDETRLHVGMHPLVRVRLLRPQINLTYDGVVWYPTNFAALGELPFRDLGALSEACAAWRGRVALALEGGTVYWHGMPDGLIASAKGVGFDVGPVSLPGHPDATFHRLRAASVVEPAGRQTDNVSIEWLAAGPQRYIEIDRASTVPTGDDAGFWGVADDHAIEH